MEFEWDEDKRRRVLAERNVDLIDAALIFEGPVITKADGRHDYGEPRFVSLGMVEGKAFYVVHTTREGVVRLITAWQGGRHGERKYQARFPGGN